MATAKPRVSVTLEPEMYDTLRELAALNGESLSSVIAGLLDALSPTVVRVVEAGRQFQALSAEMQERARETFVEAERTITPAVEELTAQALAAFEALGGNLPPAAQDPRPVTRGSRPPTPNSSRAKSGPSA